MQHATPSPAPLAPSPAQRAIDKVRLDRDCPHLHEAIDELFDLLQQCDVDPRVAIGNGSTGALLARMATPAAWLAAGWIAPDVWRSAVIASGAEAFLAAGGQPAQFVDGWLVPEFVVALAHFPSDRHRHQVRLRDALAALAAVEANRALIDPVLLPEALQDAGCWLRPGLASALMAGRYLADRVGVEAAIAAAAGAAPIEDALDDADLAEIEALCRGAHAASALLPKQAAALTEHTAVWVEDVVLLLTSRRRREGGMARPVQVQPDGGGLRFDLTAAVASSLGAPASLGQHTAQGWLDPQLARLALPAGPCVRAALRGWAALDIVINHFEELDDLVVALLDTLDDPPELGNGAATTAGDGFELRWIPPAPKTPADRG